MTMLALSEPTSTALEDALARAHVERDAAYRQRAVLAAYLASLHPSSLEPADPSPGFAYVLYVDTPAGQVSYHVADGDLDLFHHVPRDMGRRWDGSPPGVNEQRLRMLSGRSAAASHLRVEVALIRLPKRARCPGCGRRRVLFGMAAMSTGVLATVARGRCSDCAGLRHG